MGFWGICVGFWGICSFILKVLKFWGVLLWFSENFVFVSFMDGISVMDFVKKRGELVGGFEWVGGFGWV